MEKIIEGEGLGRDGEVASEKGSIGHIAVGI